MPQFTKKKFCSLPISQQHKKCAEILKNVYHLALEEASLDKLTSHYLELLTWMETESFKKKESPKTLEDIANHYHQHLKKAQCHLKEHNLLPPIKKGDKKRGKEPYPINIYLDQLRSAHNVGSIIRTIEAMSLGTLYFSKDTPFIDNKQVQKCSMNTYNWISCCDKKNLKDLPKPMIALETSPHATPLFDFIFPETFTLVVGNEETGCSNEVLKLADFLIEIPLRGRKNSLNVANAFAIAASEIQKQKR